MLGSRFSELHRGRFADAHVVRKACRSSEGHRFLSGTAPRTGKNSLLHEFSIAKKHPGTRSRVRREKQTWGGF